MSVIFFAVSLSVRGQSCFFPVYVRVCCVCMCVCSSLCPGDGEKMSYSILASLMNDRFDWISYFVGQEVVLRSLTNNVEVFAYWVLGV